MQLFVDAWSQGWAMLTSGAVGVWQIVLTSLLVSGTATLLALLIGLPVGYLIGSKYFVGRRAALILFNAGMGLPPTVVGLVVAMTFSRRGPLGPMGLLYSRPAVVVAQLVISVPVVIAITAAAVAAVPRDLISQARSLGAGRLRLGALTLSEARLGLLAAVAGGFGSIISEVGASNMVGGNLEGDTQTMTTAMMQYARTGDYGTGLALAAVLLTIVVFVNAVLTGFQTSAERWERGG